MYINDLGIGRNHSVQSHVTKTNRTAYRKKTDDYATVMKEAVEKFKGILAENGAELVNEELWGLRKLAYPIQKKSTGFYCLFEFKAEPDFMKKLETDFRRDERVIRFLTFRLDKYAVEYAEKRRRVRASKASETSVEAVEVAEETVEAKEN